MSMSVVENLALKTFHSLLIEVGIMELLAE